VARPLRRYLTSTPFLALVAAVAVAKASFGLAVAISGTIVAPLAFSVEAPAPGETVSYPGWFKIAGRLVDWADPLAALLTLAIVSAFVFFTVRRRRVVRTDCPHCHAEILAAATACFSCTRAVS
jgi:hypothetical protein